MRKFLMCFLLISILVPKVVFATSHLPVFTGGVTASTNPCSLEGIKGVKGGAATTFPTCVNQIYVWSLGLAVLLAILMAVVGGYYYMTASGNAEQSAKGKEIITSSLIGLVILFCAYLLLNTINPDLVNFNLDSLK